MKHFIAIAVLCVSASIAQAEIPQGVIDECNELHADSYNQVPDCLKGGTVGYEMLQQVVQDEFYGAPAQKVIDGCRVRNESFETVWICFENAAEKAVETYEMIGADNMKDACFRSISDPATYEKVEVTYQSLRDEYIGDRYFSGGTRYFPFRGCPDEDPEVKTETEQTSNETNDPASGFSEEACAAYRDFEDVFASNSTKELEALFFAGDDTQTEDDKLASMKALGVSQASIDFLSQGDEKQDLGSAFVISGFINEYHPDLLDRFMESDVPEPASEMENLGREMALGLLQMAVEGYRDSCF